MALPPARGASHGRVPRSPARPAVPGPSPIPNSPVAWNFKVVYSFPFAFGFQEYLMGRVRGNGPTCRLPLEIKQVLGPSLAKLVSCGS